MKFSLLVCQPDILIRRKYQLAYHSCRLIFSVLSPFLHQCSAGSGCDRCCHGCSGLLFKPVARPCGINIRPRCRNLIIHRSPRRIIPIGKPRKISVTVICHNTKYIRQPRRKYVCRVRKTGLTGCRAFISRCCHDHCFTGSRVNGLFQFFIQIVCPQGHGDDVCSILNGILYRLHTIFC